MRTTLDLPEDILRQAKIAASERGSSLRQLVIDALRREIGSEAQGSRRRLASPPVKLSQDAALRTLSPDEIKRIDMEANTEAEVARARAPHR